MKEKKFCAQTNIPQVDNSELDCSNGLHRTSCVIRTSAISYLGLPEDSTLDDIIDNLLLSLIDARNRLVIAEGKIDALENA